MCNVGERKTFLATMRNPNAIIQIKYHINVNFLYCMAKYTSNKVIRQIINFEKILLLQKIDKELSKINKEK